jgi:putative membrane protein
MGWFGAVMMVTVWAVFIVGIVWLVRSLSSQGHGDDSARRILDQRFASGELTVEDYEARRKALR